MIDDRTVNLDFPLPNSANRLDEDVARLRNALSDIDAAVHALQDPDVAAIAALSGTGLIERTGAGTAGTVTITEAGKAILDDADATAQRLTLGLGNAATRNVGTEAGTVASGAHAHSDLYQPVSDTLTGLTVSASQAEMEAGTEAALRSMSPLRVAQAIAALGGGGGASVTLSGNITLYINQSTTLTITNFNVFSTYSVAVSAGSVSRTGDSISLTAPASAQTVTLTVTMDGDAYTFALVIQAAGIATPTNSTPANAATSQGKNPTLNASAFATVGATDTHASSDWQLATDSGFTTVVQSQTASTSNKTSWTVADLTVSTTYYWRVRYNSTNTGTSQWSTAFSFTTAASFGPTTIGEAYGGGYYAGKINDGGTQYYLIVAPKSSGENSSKQWKTTNDTTAGTTSVIAGPTNSANMNNASHPAAQFCEGLTIGGFSDWYMPAKNELEVLYYFLKPTTDANNTSSGSNANAVSPEPISTNYSSGSPARTSAAAFQSGGAEAFAAVAYWSSTEGSATGAWFQGFSNGTQDYDYKGNSTYVRAVRRLAI